MKPNKKNYKYVYITFENLMTEIGLHAEREIDN